MEGLTKMTPENLLLFNQALGWNSIIVKNLNALVLLSGSRHDKHVSNTSMKLLGTTSPESLIDALGISVQPCQTLQGNKTAASRLLINANLTSFMP